MWRTAAPIVVLLAVLMVLLVPFHPDAVVLSAVVAVSPHTPFAWRLDWFLVETGGNFVMFAAVGVAARLFFRRPLLALITACSVSGAAELVQLVIPNRVASWTDFATNVLGAFVGVIAVLAIQGRRRRSIESRSATNESR